MLKCWWSTKQFDKILTTFFFLLSFSRHGHSSLAFQGIQQMVNMLYDLKKTG